MLSSITGISDPFLRELSDVYNNILTAVMKGTVNEDDVAKLAPALNKCRAIVLPIICPQLFKSASDVPHIDGKDILPAFSGLILHLSAYLNFCSEDHLGVIKDACYEFKAAAKAGLSIMQLEGVTAGTDVGGAFDTSLSVHTAQEATLKEAAASSGGSAAP